MVQLLDFHCTFVVVKQSLVILALIGLMAQVLTVPFLAFQLESQRSVIALTQCENIDKPQLQCAGSCYISTQLGEAFEQNQQQTPANEASPTVSLPPFSTPPQLDWQLKPLVAEDQMTCFGQALWATRLMDLSIWHPPRA